MTLLGDNPYNADSIITANLLCQLAKMEGWHDHHAIKGLSTPEIGALVDGYISGLAGNVPCGFPSPNSEDQFMYNMLLQDSFNQTHQSYCKPTNVLPTGFSTILTDHIYVHRPTDNTIFSNTLKDRYTIAHILRQSDKEGDEEDDDEDESAVQPVTEGEQVSYIQTLLNHFSINENIHIIRDVARGNYAKDVRLFTGEQQIINVLTASSIYDPGPTVSPFTGSGKKQGFTDPASSSFFALMDDARGVETTTNYPAYTNTPNDHDPTEKMMYSKYDCAMTAKATMKNDPKQTLKDINATLYIKDGDSVFCVDKNNSNKSTDKADLPFKEVTSTIGCMGYKLPIGHPFDEGEFKKGITKSGNKKLLSKKYGDHAQALTTLRKLLYFRKYYKDGKGFGSTEISNGLHAFVSYDKCAITGALLYGAPMVIYITEAGFIIYISNKIIDKFQSTQKKIENNLNLMENTLKTYTDLFSTMDTMISSINNTSLPTYNEIAGLLTQLLQQCNTKLDVREQNGRLGRIVKTYDIQYRLWLFQYYIFHNVVKALQDTKQPIMTPEQYTLENVSTIITNLQGLATAKTALQVDPTNEIALLQQTIDLMNNNDLLSLQRAIGSMKQIIAYNEHLNLVIYLWNSALHSIGLDTLANQDKILKAIMTDPYKHVKKINPLIVAAIQSITPFESLHNPGCLMSMMKCFSGKTNTISIGEGVIIQLLRSYGNNTLFENGMSSVITKLIEVANTDNKMKTMLSYSLQIMSNMFGGEIDTTGVDIEVLQKYSVGFTAKISQILGGSLHYQKGGDAIADIIVAQHKYQGYIHICMILKYLYEMYTVDTSAIDTIIDAYFKYVEPLNDKLQAMRTNIHTRTVKDVTEINEINDFDLVGSQIYGKENQEALRTIKKWLNKQLNGSTLPLDLSKYVVPPPPTIDMDSNPAYLNYEILRFSQMLKRTTGDIHDIYANFTLSKMDIDSWNEVEIRKQGITTPPPDMVTGKRTYVPDNMDIMDEGIGLHAPMFNIELNKLQRVYAGKSTRKHRHKSTRKKFIPKKRHQSRMKKQLPKRKTRKNQLSTHYKRHGKRTSKNGFHHERSE